MSQELFPRFLEATISGLLSHMRVVAVNGPRQSGKTTLIRKFASGRRSFHSLEDPSTYDHAISDPVGFIKGIEYGAIDEIQKAPRLINVIKMSVDADTRPGRFLLAGSADILRIPTISESLAGRMAIVRLLPLAQAEIEGTGVSFLDDLFKTDVPPFKRPLRKVDNLEDRVLRGGYPEMRLKTSESDRWEWARNWVEGVLQRDINEIGEAYRIQDLPRLAESCAMRSGELVSHAGISRRAGIGAEAARRHLDTLEQFYLLGHLHSWFSDDLKRLRKTPRLHFLDSGLLCAILQIDLELVRGDRALLGRLLKPFALAELQKIAGWSRRWMRFHYYRDKAKNEVDFVVTHAGDSVVGIEVKASERVRSDDLNGLRKLREVAGSSFRNGVLLYAGEEVVPFGDGLYAAPISALWSGGLDGMESRADGSKAQPGRIQDPGLPRMESAVS